MKKQFLSLILLFAPIALIIVLCPSAEKIVKNKVVKCPSITDEKGKTIDTFIVWGDIFSPRFSNIPGWDLVGIPMYFDPITINKTQKIVNTPVFHNALVNSTSSKSEFEYITSHLVKAATDNSEEIMCILSNKRIKTCEGDQINPYIWPSYPNSNIHKDNDIKFLAALPIFDNKSFLKTLVKEMNGESSGINILKSETRDALAKNVEYATSALIGEASYNNKVRSIAIPIIGSTSHNGGDSKLFLNFSEGVISIFKGIKRSDANFQFSKIYIVGFNLHTGVFKTEAIQALQKFWFYSFLENFNKEYKWSMVTYYSIVFFVFLLLYYSSYAKNYFSKRVSRINIFAVGSGISVFFGSIVTSLSVMIIPKIEFSNLSILAACTALSILLMYSSFLFLTKTIIKP